MSKELQAVILAGGKGTRLGSIGKKLPKAMIEVNGEPFIDKLISQLKKNNIKNFLILTGYKKKIIQNYFKNKKNIKIHNGQINWSTLKRIVNAKKLIKKDFLLMYCDNYLHNYNLRKQISLKNKKKSNLIFSVVIKKNNQKGTILKDKQKIYYKKGIVSKFTEAGYILTNKKFFFRDIKKFKQNIDLSEYLTFLTKNYSSFGINYNKKYQCIENQNLLNQTKKYFKVIQK